MSRSRKSNSKKKQAPQGGAASNKRGGNRRRKKQAKAKANPLTFWGDPDKLKAIEPPSVDIVSYPPAVVKSLGRPPLSGHQNASEHYFTAVYERAVNVGAALAAAGNLVEADDLVGDNYSG